MSKRADSKPDTAKIADFQQENNSVTVDKRWAELKIDGSNINGRSYHSMSYYNENIILYGGYDKDSGLVDDFLKMKLSDQQYSWQKIQCKSQLNPGQRRNHITQVYQDKLYLFGGQKSNIKTTNDLYRFDFKQNIWELVQPQGAIQPPPTDSHCSCIAYENDPQNAQLIILCGFQTKKQGTAAYSNEIYSYMIQRNEWKLLYEHNGQTGNIAPCPRSNSACSIQNNKIYLFGGGTSEKKFNDLWVFDLNNQQWQKIVQNQGNIQPEVRTGHSMVLYKNYIFIFGGIQDVSKEKNDVYAYSVQSKTWRIVQHNTNEFIQIENNNGNNKKRTISPRRQTSSPRRFQSMLATGNSPTKRNTKEQFKGQDGVSPLAGKSPLLYGKSPLRKKNNPADELFNINSQSGTGVQMNCIEEKKKQEMLKEKYKMLEELELDQQIKPICETPDSPITKSLKISHQRFGNQIKPSHNNISKINFNSRQQQQQITQLTDSKLRSGQEIDAIYNDINTIANSQEDDSQNYLIENNLLIGKKPCGRDGQAAILTNQGQMIIVGGDRHLMSFNDTYLFDLEQSLKQDIM